MRCLLAVELRSQLQLQALSTCPTLLLIERELESLRCAGMVTTPFPNYMYHHSDHSSIEQQTKSTFLPKRSTQQPGSPPRPKLPKIETQPCRRINFSPAIQPPNYESYNRHTARMTKYQNSISIFDGSENITSISHHPRTRVGPSKILIIPFSWHDPRTPGRSCLMFLIMVIPTYLTHARTDLK